MANKKDRERFERIMLGYLDASYNLALWLLHDPSDAEDIVQIAYLKAFENFATYKEGNAAGWILTIVRNTAYNWLNKQKRNSNLISFDEVLHGGKGSFEEIFQDGESDTSSAFKSIFPEDIVSAAATRSQMMECMERLSIEFREAMFLREIEGYSYKEIAEITQVPKGTVMSRLSRARRQLQKMLVNQQHRTKTSGL